MATVRLVFKVFGLIFLNQKLLCINIGVFSVIREMKESLV